MRHKKLLMFMPFALALLALFAAERDKSLYLTHGFAGNSTGGRGASGPAAVFAIHKAHELEASDGHSSAKVISLDAGSAAVRSSISTGGHFHTEGRETLSRTDSALGVKPDPAKRGAILESYGALPLSFEANHGQTDPQVNFLSRGHDHTFFLTGDGVIFSLNKIVHAPEGDGQEQRDQNATLRMEILGANRKAPASGVNELPGKSNYFIGNHPAGWRTNVANYAKVRYEGVYPGVDLVYYGNQRQLEYDFIVGPGADPSSIRLKLYTDKLAIDEHGDLLLAAGAEEVRLRKPQMYQEINGAKKVIEGGYRRATADTISFQIAGYDRSQPLVIDPILAYSSYLGDQSYGIAVDSAGSAYVTGNTQSTNFPTMNPYQPASGGGSSGTGPIDAFITKIDASGALVYSTYLGGSGNDTGQSIAVDSVGNAYVTGSTSSTDFPISNAFQPAIGVSPSGGLTVNAFVTKLNAVGTALVYSSYLGGTNSDKGYGIAVDSAGSAYVTGATTSNDFPTANAFQPAPGIDLHDAFVTKVNASGTALVYSSYLGGKAEDIGYGVAVDLAGNAYVTGSTASTDFPTVNALQPSAGDPQGSTADAFVTKINASGTALVYSTYLGGSEDDAGYGIAVDPAGNTYVTGGAGLNFPATSTFPPGQAYGAFVTEINAADTALVYSSILGGNKGATGRGIALDSAGNAYVTGFTFSNNFPTLDAFQSSGGGIYPSVFITEFNAGGTALVYSSYLGGSSINNGYGIALDSAGNAYVTGSTGSTDFPTVNAFQSSFGDGPPAAANNNKKWDGFVAKIALTGSVNGPSSPWPPDRGISDATNLTAHWGAVTGATQYQVYFGSSPNTLFLYYLYTTVSAPTVNAAFYNLAAGTTYYWQVVALTGGNSVTGPVWSFTTPGLSQTFSAPTLVWPLNGSTSAAASLNVQWAPVFGASQYQVYFGTSSTSLSPSATVNVPFVVAPFYNLNAGVTYYWKVVALAGSNSADSAVWSFTTPGGSQTFSPPTVVWPLNGSTSGATSLNVQWSSVPGATDYQVYFGSSPASLSHYATVSAPAVAAALYNLSAGTTYYWKVVALAGTNSAGSAVWSFNTPGP